jgi:uncharacterized membrane protein
MDHHPIYKDQHFTITKELFMTGNIRYSLHQLCSIKLVKAKREIPFTLLVLELVLMAAGLLTKFPFHTIITWLGALGMAASVLNYLLRKPVHQLFLTFSSGEREVIGVTDYYYLEGLANAFSRTVEETRLRQVR